MIALVTKGSINGRNALSFSGNAAQRCRQTTGDTGINGPVTVLTVRQFTNAAGQETLYDSNNATHRVMGYKQDGTTLYLRRGGTAIGIAHVPETVAVIQEDVYLVNNSYVPYYESRIAVNGVSSGLVNTATDSSHIIGWNLGVNQSNAYRMTGLIGECVVFQGEASTDANLDTRDVYKCRRYLANNWGIDLQQDVHRIVVFEGNSLVAGLYTTNPPNDCPPAQLQTLLGAAWDPYYVYGTGNSGNMWSDMVGQYVIQVGSRFRAGAAKNILIAYENTNSLLNYSAESAVAQQAAYCASARALGWEVWAATCIKFDGGLPLYETRRLAANTAIRSSWPTFADRLYDIAARAELLDNTNETYFYTDHKHLTTAGAAIMADEAYNMLTA